MSLQMTYELKTEELKMCVDEISDALKTISAHQKKIQDKHKRKEDGYTSKTLDKLEAEYRVKCIEIKTKCQHMESVC
ncbi:hypothetical protein DPMN_103547 [Dreissena polymorpha]|uniref:Uncharacterized protein n=1 Tax=Dreissena polymorpha TaxID=45954 RepID=A0A9D4H8N6_DREPO|nr:hypothetical protein DPMN_103547 [Dreissena polymorpha]